jgi:hypothetical protein
MAHGLRAINMDPVGSYQFEGTGCRVPRRDAPPIAACSFILSGPRVFGIRDPYRPRAPAYFVAPSAPSPVAAERGNFAMSKPVLDVAREHVWYGDGNSGLYAVRMTNGAWPDGPPPRCVRRRSFLLPLSRRLQRARVTVDGRRAKVRRRGERLRVRVSRRGKRVGEVAVVRIAGRKRAAGRVVRTRRYRACASR